MRGRGEVQQSLKGGMFPPLGGGGYYSDFVLKKKVIIAREGTGLPYLLGLI